MTTKAIVERLEQSIGLLGLPQKLTTAIEHELVDHFGLPSIQAAEKAEAAEAVVARMIAQRAVLSEQNGTSPVLALIGVSSNIVAGFCHGLSSDASGLAAAKHQRAHVGAILSTMRELSFAQFEAFGARILAAIGAAYAHVTPQGGDQGIDFYGHLSVGQFQPLPTPFLKLAHDIVISFVGQAKHYPNSALGPDIVRELIGATSLARTKTFSRPDLDIFRNLSLKPFSPLVTLLFTTGRITSGAAELAAAAGIIARSGEQLAVFLADKAVGFIETGTGFTFDKDLFIAWLETGNEHTPKAHI